MSGYDIISIFIDGKSFAENELIIGLGITLGGKKIVLEFIESSKENHRVCRDFMNGLINCIKNLMRQVGIYTDRVSHWQNSNQRQRWVGTALQEVEPNLRKIKGFRHLKKLRAAMKNPGLKEKTKPQN